MTAADESVLITTERSGLPAERGWWRKAVVYQIYPRSFADSNGDGMGDLRGIIAHLDHLERLGVDVVWLSPAYRSPQDDNGYDIADYQDIDPMFGTLADMDELIAGLHARGIRLVMDLVVNHTSDEHPWFTASRSSTHDPLRDWYVWRPARPGTVPGEPGAEPNNWGSIFSGPAWELDPATGEYYLHLFTRKQPDLNWENPEVRHAVHDMMRWWVARGVDGFRMDVINFISKVEGLPDGEVHDGALYGNGFPFFAGGPRLHEYLAEINREVFGDDDAAARFLTVGEMPGSTVEQAQRFTDPARREVDMIFQFEHMEVDEGPGGKFDPRPIHLPELKRSLARWQDGLAESGWNSLYWSNHDRPRAVSRFGDDSPQHREASAKALATVLHLMRGTPYVYQGEELGMTNTVLERLEDYRDVESLNYFREATEARGADPAAVLRAMAYAGRDNSRTPVQWDASANAGFTTGEPWIPVTPNYVEINAAAQVDDPTSVFSHYRELVRLRHELAIVADGSLTMHLLDDEQVFAYSRALGDEGLLVLANLSSSPATVDAAALGWTSGRVVISNLPDAVPALGAPGDLRPGGAGAGSRWAAVGSAVPPGEAQGAHAPSP